MRNLLQSFIRFVVRHILTFFLIVAILLAGKWAVAEWRAYQSVRSGLPVLQRSADTIAAYRSGLTADVSARVATYRNASIARLGARIEEINKSLAAKSRVQQAPLLSFPLSEESLLTNRLQEYFQRAIEIELLTQERIYLTQLRASINAGLDLQAANQKLAQLRQEHIAVYDALQENLQMQKQIVQENPVRMWIVGTLAQRQFVALKDDERRLRQQNTAAYNAYHEQKALIGRMPAPDKLSAFQVNEERIDAVLRPLQDAVAEGHAHASQNWMAKVSGPVREVAPTAALIVLALFLVPVFIKVLFYFVLAPLATRLKPLVVDSAADGTIHATDGHETREMTIPRISAVSQSVLVGPDEELLIHAEYIQSSPVKSRKDTKWLMDWSYPFTSLAAGLVAMTRIRTLQTDSVVLSPTADPLSEIAVLSLPAGAALVFQPRGLVGVLYRKDRPLRISSHWRLGTLHAWLTLQLRYLVLHGPVTLIVKGCRGVRMEPAGSSRNISQSATLGFSANVGYSTIRSETFFPYLIGKQALLNDRFDGKSGYYIYEETPRTGKKPGLLGRGIEGLADAVLKVFGI